MNLLLAAITIFRTKEHRSTLAIIFAKLNNFLHDGLTALQVSFRQEES